MSTVIVILSALLSISVLAHISLYFKIEKDNTELKDENRRLTLRLYSLRETLSIMVESTKDIPTEPNIKEAVYYAMIKAHPDNGGKPGDFIKFRELYERIK